MRLYKKVGVCLLAAVMALSMMTGCSGGNTPEKPADSKPGTSEGGTEQPTPEPGGSGTGENKKDDAKTDETATPADPAKVTWETSMTQKYFQGIRKDNFRISGLNGGYVDGTMMAYAVQGKKQLLVDQRNNGYWFFYTPDGQELYVLTLAQLPDNGVKVNQLTGWQTVEASGKEHQISDEEIAKKKAEALEWMNDTKETLYFVDKVSASGFRAENKVMMNTDYYLETMTNVMVGGQPYTYTTVFAKTDDKTLENCKAGDMAAMIRFSAQGNGTQFMPRGKISACTDDTFPVIH